MGPKLLALIVLGMVACTMPLAAETIRVTDRQPQILADGGLSPYRRYD